MSTVVKHPLIGVVLRRLALSVPLLFIVSALSFVLISAAPGDVTASLLNPFAPRSAYVELRHKLGIDQPMPVQYAHWLEGAVRGDLGNSLLNGRPVTATIAQRYSVTLSLALGALLVVALVGVGAGMFSAIRGGILGRLVDGLSLLGFALPGFWVGALLVSLFAVRLGWLPAIGFVPFTQSPVDWARSLILPVIALALASVAVIAKQTREAVLDVLASEHIRIARANGIPARTIQFKLVLKCVAPRIVTILGLQAVGLLVSTVFVEKVFALPGLGSAMVDATIQADFRTVQGIAVFFAIVIVAINLIVDVTYTFLDPRMRTS